jgi:hypothetical protein
VTDNCPGEVSLDGRIFIHIKAGFFVESGRQSTPSGFCYSGRRNRLTVVPRAPPRDCGANPPLSGDGQSRSRLSACCVGLGLHGGHAPGRTRSWQGHPSLPRYVLAFGVCHLVALNILATSSKRLKVVVMQVTEVPGGFTPRPLLRSGTVT